MTDRAAGPEVACDNARRDRRADPRAPRSPPVAIRVPASRVSRRSELARLAGGTRRAEPTGLARSPTRSGRTARAGSAQAAAIRTLPAALRTALDEGFRFDTLLETEVRPADRGLTEKALHRLSDGVLIESVLMHYPARTGHRERHTVCISSQAGCAVGCPFCATGELGFGRDLETAEIVDQVREAARRLAVDGRSV